MRWLRAFVISGRGYSIGAAVGVIGRSFQATSRKCPSVRARETKFASLQLIKSLIRNPNRYRLRKLAKKISIHSDTALSNKSRVFTSAEFLKATNVRACRLDLFAVLRVELRWPTRGSAWRFAPDTREARYQAARLRAISGPL